MTIFETMTQPRCPRNQSLYVKTVSEKIHIQRLITSLGSAIVSRDDYAGVIEVTQQGNRNSSPRLRSGSFASLSGESPAAKNYAV